MAKATPFDRYQRVDDSTKQRIISANFGEAGTGKTSWWLGAPGPIVVQSFDFGLEGVVETFAKEKEIYVVEYELMDAEGNELTKERGEEVREKFIEDYEHALKVARTIIWDRETDVFDLFKYAEQGSVSGDVGTKPLDWDALKARLRRLINRAKATDINFGLIQGMKNEWVKGATNQNTGKKGITQSGNRVRKGMDDIDALVHLNIEHVRVPGSPSTFLLNVGKSRGPGSKDVQDQQFEDLDFKTFAMLLYPDSVESDWE